MTFLRGRTDASASGSASNNLLTRGSWKRELWRLLDTSEDDDALTEHDLDDVDLEGVLVALQTGLDDAQEWLLGRGLAGWWVTRSDALSWSGTDATTGGTYTSLPSDFRRLAGDNDRSALVQEDGDPWGHYVEWEQRRMQGAGYYFREGKLWLLRKASPPATLYMEYVRRLTLPSSDSTTFSEFPRFALPLIPALAAEYLMDEAFLPGGPELERKIERRVRLVKKRTVQQLRLTQGPRRFRTQPVLGSRYWL